MLRQSLDAAENLPKEAPRQVALSQLEHEVSSMPDQPPAGLEQPLLQARQRPALNGQGQDELSQQIAQIVNDHPEEQSHLIGPEPVAGGARPVGGLLALLDPLLRRPALVVILDKVPSSSSRLSGRPFARVVLQCAQTSSSGFRSGA
jgi:hypothetical protein